MYAVVTKDSPSRCTLQLKTSTNWQGLDGLEIRDKDIKLKGIPHRRVQLYKSKPKQWKSPKLPNFFKPKQSFVKRKPTCTSICKAKTRCPRSTFIARHKDLHTLLWTGIPILCQTVTKSNGTSFCQWSYTHLYVKMLSLKSAKFKNMKKEIVSRLHRIIFTKFTTYNILNLKYS